MPRSSSITPRDLDHDTYVVLDASGSWAGRGWYDDEDNYETLICDLLEGRYSPPLRIVCFNTTEGWSHVVTRDIAADLQRLSEKGQAVPCFLQWFLEMDTPAEK